MLPHTCGSATKEFLEQVNAKYKRRSGGPVAWSTAVRFLFARKFDVARALALYDQHEATRRREGLCRFDPTKDPLRTELLTGKFTILVSTIVHIYYIIAQLKTHIKAATEVEFLFKLHKDKPMHGIFYKHLEEHGLSQQLTFSFLRSSGLKSETEGFIMACQDGVFNTLVYRSRVMGVNVPDARCRACRQAPETLMYLLSACKTYAGTAYVHRHNAALRVLYYHLRHSYESVVENERCRIYWLYSFPTLELVQATKPDIVLLDRQQKTMFVIEFSAPAEVNIVSKEEEKWNKY
nr:unnamed protein product [Callosobruchus chinensis]